MNTYFIIPHGKEITQDILVPEEHLNEAKPGDIVVAEFINRYDFAEEPKAQIKEVLGQENTSGIEIEAAVRAFGLPYAWPEDLQTSLKDLSEKLNDSDLRKRKDLRGLNLITIDGEDAKDFDDAIFAERRGEHWHLIVAIADVSHYVEANSALDMEAVLRGNSVYFPGKVLPMLPEILSNNLCSLKPNVDRLCMVCDMQITDQGELKNYQFYEGVMNSKARLTYTKAASILKNQN